MPHLPRQAAQARALSVTFAGVDIGAFMQMPLDQLAALLEPIAQGDFRAMQRGRLRTRKRPDATVPGCAASGRAVRGIARRAPHPALSEEKSPRACGRWREWHACASCVGWAWAT